MKTNVRTRKSIFILLIGLVGLLIAEGLARITAGPTLA
jgi:hypothetical protein